MKLVAKTANISPITDTDLLNKLNIPNEVQSLVKDKIGRECVGMIIEIQKESFMLTKKCTTCKNLIAKYGRCQTRECKANNTSKVS